MGLFAQTDSLVVRYDKTTIEQKKFDIDQLEKYQADNDFNYDVKKRKPTFLERAWAWFKRVFTKALAWLFGNDAAVGIFAVLAKIFPYILAAIMLFLLLKFFLKVKMNSLVSGKTEKASIAISDEEKLIKNEDLQLLIKQSIVQKNYRLAVRYYYLSTLQKLSKYEFIEWQQEKTNEDYIKEIAPKEVKEKFMEGTYLYDFVWYGNFDINEIEFAKAQTEFLALNKLIK